MAAPFQVNIVITAGVSYKQEFYLTQPDKAPWDITGCEFYANLSKYPRALDAVVSTAAEPVYERTPFITEVVSGVGGAYALSLAPAVSNTLMEGKYVYSVVMKDVNGNYSEVLQGLAFVDIAFGAPTT